MTAFHPITPMEAIAFVEAAGIPDAPRVISDYAAFGLMKTYAMVIVTTAVGGRPVVVRGAAVPASLWERIILEGVLADVWTGGTVRLDAAQLKEGVPAVSITAIGFNESSLRSLVEYHRLGRVLETKIRPAPATRPRASAAADDVPDTKPRPRRPSVPPVEPGAVVATINQAMAMLSVGRTKLNKMMKNGPLEVRNVDGAPRITLASIRKITGAEAL